VSEWAFAKDGVDVPQTDIANDSKAAQLEDGTTFLGLDANRREGGGRSVVLGWGRGCCVEGG
jgi:hypothetical protein